MAAATPALAALIAAGVPHEVVKFEHDSRARSFGVEAVHALTAAGDVVAEQILKTLIIAVPNGFAVLFTGFRVRFKTNDSRKAAHEGSPESSSAKAA